jgi:hypothetical protein
VPITRYVPASTAASVMNSPRAIAAQNRRTTSASVTITSENLAIKPGLAHSDRITRRLLRDPDVMKQL